MKYQFIVICICDERKRKITELFKELGISDELIYFLEASTPQNTEDYFEDFLCVNNTTKKYICCAKSHFRAIEYAAKDESPEYSIILEDDAAFHKTYFLNVIEEIIKNWTQHFNDCNYVSLGWIPCNNFNHYTKKQKIVIKSISDIDNDICFFNDFYNAGLQCYMVKKNKIQDISLVLNQKTHNIFVNKLGSYIKNQNITAECSNNVVDFLFNRIMKFFIIFPPLVIEQKDSTSFLEHNNYNDYWSNFFKGYEEKIKEYMSY